MGDLRAKDELEPVFLTCRPRAYKYARTRSVIPCVNICVDIVRSTAGPVSPLKARFLRESRFTAFKEIELYSQRNYLPVRRD